MYPTAIILGGHLAGWASASGGSQIATRGVPDYVPGYPPPPSNAPRLFRDLVIMAGAGMSPEFYRWAAGCLAPAQEGIATGQIVSTDHAGKQIARRGWEGRVVRLQFPELDRADCRPAALRVQVEVADARAENPGSAVPHPAAAPPWRRCDFRLRIKGLNAASRAKAIGSIACHRVSRILSSGQIWLEPPVFEPITVALSAAHAAEFDAWAAAPKSRRCALEYLGPAGRPYFTLRLFCQPATPVQYTGSSAVAALSVLRAALVLPQPL